MAKIIEPPKGKHVNCNACSATIEYLPEEISRYSGTDIGGGPNGWERVKCPRRDCPGYGYIRAW